MIFFVYFESGVFDRRSSSDTMIDSATVYSVVESFYKVLEINSLFVFRNPPDKVLFKLNLPAIPSIYRIDRRSRMNRIPGWADPAGRP